jgi:hypothetical protein
MGRDSCWLPNSAKSLFTRGKGVIHPFGPATTICTDSVKDHFQVLLGIVTDNENAKLINTARAFELVITESEKESLKSAFAKAAESKTNKKTLLSPTDMPSLPTGGISCRT